MGFQMLSVAGALPGPKGGAEDPGPARRRAMPPRGLTAPYPFAPAGFDGDASGSAIAYNLKIKSLAAPAAATRRFGARTRAATEGALRTVNDSGRAGTDSESALEHRDDYGRR